VLVSYNYLIVSIVAGCGEC